MKKSHVSSLPFYCTYAFHNGGHRKTHSYALMPRKPRDKDFYTLSACAFHSASQNRYKWKGKLELEGMRVYENPIVYINEDLIRLEDEYHHDGAELESLVLNRQPHTMDYKTVNLFAQNWNQLVKVKSINELCFSLFLN
ncbi:hypothetical protein PIB30_095975 [Stylosanthes scabra]|uniref:Uncharacterized protein n=1 Tax=Stylosanthes scabra TaxID=79078 RepID=A0ABU6QYC9_9FABA|nr:hypothetical protein [Stylosanthes scabra]